MIVKLKYKTKDGNVINMNNCSILLGIDLMLISCTLKEKQTLLDIINKKIRQETDQLNEVVK